MVKNLLNLLICGDFIPVCGINRHSIWPDLLTQDDAAYMQGHDLVYLNLEIALVDVGEEVAKVGPSLRGDPKSVELMKKANCGVVNLANNHINDFGIEGIESTADLLRGEGIGWFGAGVDALQATSPYIREFHGYTFGCVGFAEEHYSNTYAGDVVVNSLVPEKIIHSIRVMRDICDYVIVTLNLGLEWVPWPSPYTQHLCRELIDVGANLVINHQPHLPRGYEKYNSGYIIYGAGSFYTPHFDSWHGMRHYDWGLMFSLGFTVDGIDLNEVRTVNIDKDGGISFLSPNRDSAKDRYISLSNRPLGEPALLMSLWQEVAMLLYEREYCNRLGWNERDLLYPAKEWLKRITLRGHCTDSATMRLKQRNMRRWELVGSRANHEVIATALGLLSGKIEDIRNKDSKKMTRELMPWLFV